MRPRHAPNCNSRFPDRIHDDGKGYGDLTCDCGLDALKNVADAAKALAKSLPIVPVCSAEKEVVEIPNHQWVGISEKALAVDRAVAALNKGE